MLYGTNIHEGEYVSIPSRRPLPINTLSETDLTVEGRSASVTNANDMHDATSGDHAGERGTRLYNFNLNEKRAKQGVDGQSVSDLESSTLRSSFATLDVNAGSNTENGDSSAGTRDESGSADAVPSLIHKWSHTHSILCVIPSPSKNLVFCGTQDSKILVYDVVNYTLKHVIHCGHSGDSGESTAILCLAIDETEQFLFSAGADSLVKVWDISLIQDVETVRCTHIVYSLVDIGDIFLICWLDATSTLLIGAQNASILWCKLHLNSPASRDSSSTMHKLPHFRYDKFFDSKGPGGAINNLQSRHQMIKTTSLSSLKKDEIPSLVEVRNEDMIRFAHYGYVYCIEQFDIRDHSFGFIQPPLSPPEHVFLTGGGDGLVKIWAITSLEGETRIEMLKGLENQESVLSMSVLQAYLYVGLSDSSVNVWDLTTTQLVRSIHFEKSSLKYDEVLSLGIYNNCIFKASNLGGLYKYTLKNYPPNVTNLEKGKLLTDKSMKLTASGKSFNEILPKCSFDQNDGENDVLAVRIFNSKMGTTYLISGGYKSLCLWDITDVGTKIQPTSSVSDEVENNYSSLDNKNLLSTLKEFVSYKTVLKCPTLYLDDSRRCSQYLMHLLRSLKASDTRLFPVPDGNPVVYACFKRSEKYSTLEKKTRLLWYAHYDVVDVDSSAWDTDPFQLVPKDGNVYGRGASDNKGPTLASLYAVSDLKQKNELSCDVVFIIEGEEECGSIGFQKVLTENKETIGEIDWILSSNSYWLDDETPCLNYGLRGVINASISVTSDKPDRHSGVDGGVLREPTLDLTQLLAQLVDPFNNSISIPNFYDDVLSLSEKEIALYQKVEKAVNNKNIKNQDFKTLMAKWRDPSLSIHRFEVSGPQNNTVIPQKATASISIRIVPHQDLEKIKKLLIHKLQSTFDKFDTDNRLLINVFHEGEPWLGDTNNLIYQILYDKIRSNWGLTVPEPLFIREGGTIPSIRFMEKCFDAPAAQIPCGQASDNAHLRNEKLRVLNLFKLRDILTDTFKEIGAK